MRLNRGHINGTASHGDMVRRAFLRKAGITGAMTAAVVGVADMAGLTSASAASRKPGAVPAGFTVSLGSPDSAASSSSCTFVHCGCGTNGRTCCSPGLCCYHCSGNCVSGKICLSRSTTHCNSRITVNC